MALVVILTPQLFVMLRDGIFSWVQGQTLLSNWLIAILLGALAANWLLVNWFYAKDIHTKEGYVVVTKRKLGCWGTLAKWGLSVLFVVALVFSVLYINQMPQQTVLASTTTGPSGNGSLLPIEQMISALQSSHLQQPDYDSIRANYNEIVTRSTDVGYDPALTMSIWVEESGASNYASYPNVADFGCTSVTRADFEAQLSCFLSLWNTYSTSPQFKECRGSDNVLSLREFLLVYEGGFKSCNANTWTAEPGFPSRLRNYYQVITGGGQLDFGP